ncbi:MAG: VWA domain-containing protein, partial [Myxococcales bacterium]|nr:VWA domain-containing protein [Myxococcales bacterium]
LPRRASIVFVLDASRSIPALAPQLDALRAYLEHVPDARVEVVLVRRFATRLAGRFLSPDELGVALTVAENEGRLALGNGSALEEGLRLAGDALRGRGGPTRVVLFSDALVRTRFTNELAFAALTRAPRGTVAHIVIPERESWSELKRADGHPLAAIPRRTGGVLFELDVSETPKELTPAVLGLVRPISVDNLELTGFAAGADVPEPPEVLGEGDAYEFMSSLASAPRSLTLRGELWSTPIQRALTTRRDYERATAAFVFSEDEYEDLAPEEMLRLAMFGRAVSPVTSYLAVEPGVRPSTVGLEEAIGLIGRGGGGGGGRGYGGSGALIRRVPLEQLLSAGVAACERARSPARGWSIEMSLETTYDEVVDVEATGASEAMRACVVEAAWALELSGYRQEREHHRLTLRATA